MERTVQPSPCLYQSGSLNNEFMLNAEWTGKDIGYWEPYLEQMQDLNKIIMSVSGRDIQGCVEVCKIIDKYKFRLIEINVSCAHSNSIHGFINRNEEHISCLIKSIKDAGVQTPISLKLGHSDYIVELSAVAKSAGVDAITAVNSFGPVFDFEITESGEAKTILGIKRAEGGLSGVPLFHIALTDVAEIKHQVKIPVIGCGGVKNAQNVLKMLMAGADAVEIYTAAHIRGKDAPSVFTEINQELLQFIKDKNFPNINNVKGKALKLLEQETNLEPVIPKICEERCTGCNKCIKACLYKAIQTKKLTSNKSVAQINTNLCNGCGHCTSVCPFKAIESNF